MTAANAPDSDTPPAIDRDDLIDALSWAEDAERGRWGTQYATAVMAAHDAHVHADLLAKNDELQSLVDIARASEGWGLAIGEILRLREQVANLQGILVRKWGLDVLAQPETQTHEG